MDIWVISTIFSDFVEYSCREGCVWSMNGSENISKQSALPSGGVDTRYHKRGALCDTEEISVRRFARPLSACLTTMVILSAIVAPVVAADDVVSQAAYEPFPEDDAAPILSDNAVSYLDDAADQEYVEGELIEPGLVDGEYYEEGEYYGEGEYVGEGDMLYADDLTAEMAPVLSSADDLGTCNWYARADFMMWARSKPKRLILAFDTSATSVFDVLRGFGPLRTDDIPFHVEPGGKITLARNLGRDYQNRDHMVEFAYLGGFEWDASLARNSTNPIDGDPSQNNGLVTPLGPSTIGAFNLANRQTIDFKTDLHSIEMNIRIQRRPHQDKMVLSPDGRWSRQMDSTFVSSFMAGLRYIRVTEDLEWDARRTQAPTATGDYDISTENNMFGGHIGSDTYWQTPNFRLGMRTQFGLLFNMAEAQSRLVIVDPTAPVTGTFNRGVEDESAAFVGEMGWSATYHVNERSSLRASYDFMWMQGTAGAFRQIDFNVTAPAKLNLGANNFYQGFSFGFEHIW